MRTAVRKKKEYIQMVKQSKVDGIIGITYSDIDKYVSSNLPFVSIDRHFSEQVSYVTADNYLGGQIAAQELLTRNCKTCAMLGVFHLTLTKQTIVKLVLQYL